MRRFYGKAHLQLSEVVRSDIEVSLSKLLFFPRWLAKRYGTRLHGRTRVHVSVDKYFLVVVEDIVERDEFVLRHGMEAFWTFRPRRPSDRVAGDYQRPLKAKEDPPLTSFTR